MEAGVGAGSEMGMLLWGRCRGMGLEAWLNPLPTLLCNLHGM